MILEVSVETVEAQPFFSAFLVFQGHQDSPNGPHRSEMIRNDELSVRKLQYLQKAFRMPALAATPPWKETGFTNFFPFPMLLLKFLARA